MTLSILSPIRHYQVRTEVFEGPLDLLLALIQRMELDITRLALAQITDQYLAEVRAMQDRSPEEMSAFLAVAARLLYIKSQALLPRPADDATSADEEDPGDALLRQLRAYRRYKRAAQWLRQRLDAGQRTVPRLAAPPRVPVTPQLDLGGFTVADLRLAARRLLLPPPQKTLGVTLAPPRVTVRDKIRAIFSALRARGRTSFFRLVRRRPRQEIPVTFLALLELVKRRIVRARQERLFGDITLEPAGPLPEHTDLPTEFE